MFNQRKKTVSNCINGIKLIIGGHKNHGKDTVAEILRDHYNLDFLSSSRFACEEFLFDELKVKHNYKSFDECFNDRINHREVWYQGIRKFNEGDRARMGKLIYLKAPVYCGIRDAEEFFALRAAKQFDVAIWVDGSSRKPPESKTSNSLSQTDFDITLDNNGSIEDLHLNVARLIDFLTGIELNNEPE